jgi:hypothetical protein
MNNSTSAVTSKESKIFPSRTNKQEDDIITITENINLMDMIGKCDRCGMTNVEVMIVKSENAKQERKLQSM